jgi:signal transduction histidine kinase
LAQRLDSAREDERKSVAITLHEGLAQDLYACSLALTAVRSKTERGGDAHGAVDELGALLDKCIADTRQIAGDLHPQALSHFSLLENIERHARFVESSSTLKIQAAQVGSFPVLDEDIKLMFFRAAQEALKNIAQHAHASRASISLLSNGDTVILEIVDDGIGMPNGALHKRGSLGLLGIRERFGAVGGDLAIDRNPPLGTTFRVRLPIPIRRS